MAWLILALGAIALYLILTAKPGEDGPQLDRKRLRGIEQGRERMRREHEARCAGRCEHE